jgi:ATP-dependent 26S proteasome regulatory subunit
MFKFPFKKVFSLTICAIFLFSDLALGAPPNNKSFFKDRKPNYQKISEQNEALLNKKKAIHQGEGEAEAKEKQKKQTQRILSSHLEDLSQIHIPPEIGRVIEVYQAENRTLQTENRLIIHIQDLHTNPEAELNLAKILELLLKDYQLGLVCSEGADGEVDTSSVSSFPD